MMPSDLKYLTAYPAGIKQQVQQMIARNTLSQFLQNKYPICHSVNNDKALREYVLQLKNNYLKKSKPLSQIVFDDKIHIINNALGTHSYHSRVQGGKLKGKNLIRISSLFKKTPEVFLQMIVVHELAHLKEKEHNKAFYQLCLHMMPDYHQIEFDVRLYLTQLEIDDQVFSATGPRPNISKPHKSYP